MPSASCSDLGCELAQGYLFGQPLTPLAMRRLLERNIAVPTPVPALAALPAGKRRAVALSLRCWVASNKGRDLEVGGTAMARYLVTYHGSRDVA